MAHQIAWGALYRNDIEDKFSRFTGENVRPTPVFDLVNLHISGPYLYVTQGPLSHRTIRHFDIQGYMVEGLIRKHVYLQAGRFNHEFKLWREQSKELLKWIRDTTISLP